MAAETMSSPGRSMGFDHFVLGNSGHQLQSVDILSEGSEKKSLGVDEALEVVTHRRLDAGVEKLFGQEEKRLRVGQVIVNLEKALRLRQVEFGGHRVVKAAAGSTEVGDASLENGENIKTFKWR